MRKFIVEGALIALLIFVYFFAVTHWAVSGEKALYETDVLAEAFEYCGVSWDALDEQCQTANYIHRRNAEKKHSIIMHKYNCRDYKESDVYFFVGRGEENCWVIRSSQRGEGVLTWTVNVVDIDDESAPETKLFRSMLLEYVEWRSGMHRNKPGKNPKPKRGKIRV